VPRRNQSAASIHALRRVRSVLDVALEYLDEALEEMAGNRTAAEPPDEYLVSPTRRAALKLQGQYMGYMRKLKPKQKAQVKAVREKKGIRAAIAAAKKMGGA
jgi:hypothetical protein